MSIVANNITKYFGAHRALNDVSFEIGSGELVALLGPSGGGKSTILRVLAGLEQPDQGSVHFEGLEATYAPVEQRSIGFVFQHYALFRHLTVAQNIAFGLEIRKVSKEKIAVRTEELLSLVALSGYGHRYPAQLSGGQRQRVALARALAPEPKLLLLDEPFGAIDAKVRQELRDWLRRLHDQAGVTSIFVTHDQEEAFSVADRVLLINHGRLEQDGSPSAFFDAPKNSFVARFVGNVSVLDGQVRGREVTAGELTVPLSSPHDPGPVEVVLRAEDIKVVRDSSPVATVERSVRLGAVLRVHLDVDGAGPIVAEWRGEPEEISGLDPGVRVGLSLKHVRVFPKVALSGVGAGEKGLEQPALAKYSSDRPGLKRSA